MTPPPAETPVQVSTGEGGIRARGTAIKFWGVRGSIPTPGPSTVFFGGNTACVELRTGGEIIILDAGSGIRGLGRALEAEFGTRPINLTLLITHTHWDHIQGFPFFLPAYKADNRLRILGYEGARDSLRATLAGQMESPYFPIALNQMPGNIVIEELKEMQFSIGEVKTRACRANHPGVCVGYRISTDAGSIVYMPDHETVSDAEKRAEGGTRALTPECELIEFLRDAEIFIADAQYDAAEYAEHIGWGHGCLDEVVRLALAANVKRLFLFHYDPAHDDQFITQMVGHARALAEAAGSTLQIEAAREGAEITLGVRSSAASGKGN